MAAEISQLFNGGSVAAAANPETGGRIGIVDIGSNTVRLVVFDAPARLPVPIFNERVTCRLGRGIGQTGRLDPEGIELAFKALARFTAIAREIPVERFKMVATAAVRDATDGRAFTDEVAARFRYPVDVLSGAEEARLSAAGILGGTPDADGILGDLGGGSLDLVDLQSGQFGDNATLPMGHLRLSEDSGNDAKSAENIAGGMLGSVAWLRGRPGRNLYAVGGALRAIARIYIEQTDYPLHVLDNLTIAAGDVRDLCRILAGLSSASVGKMAGVARRRADTLPFAALALGRLLNEVQPKSLIISGYGLREGLFFETLPSALKSQDPLIAACEGFALRSGRFAVHGDEIFEWIAPLFSGFDPADLRVFRAASLLSDIGWTEHPDYRALHAFIRVLRFPIAGLTHRERVMLALAIFVRYNGPLSKYEVKRVLPLISREEQHQACVVGTALRLAHVFSGGIPGLLPRSELTNVNGKVALRLDAAVDSFSGSAAQRVLKQLAEIINSGPAMA
jgi:exopolyphosphatase/guanosine-5'-triphosphate,3'-diphosphate pyrophosphatase